MRVRASVVVPPMSGTAAFSAVSGTWLIAAESKTGIQTVMVLGGSGMVRSASTRGEAVRATEANSSKRYTGGTKPVVALVRSPTRSCTEPSRLVDWSRSATMPAASNWRAGCDDGLRDGRSRPRYFSAAGRQQGQRTRSA